MRSFKSIEKIDTAILYGLELISSISIVLLALGLILSMANVLTNGIILTDNPDMRVIWAIIQCVAIETAVAPNPDNVCTTNFGNTDTEAAIMSY